MGSGLNLDGWKIMNVCFVRVYVLVGHQWHVLRSKKKKKKKKERGSEEKKKGGGGGGGGGGVGWFWCCGCRQAVYTKCHNSSIQGLLAKNKPSYPRGCLVLSKFFQYGARGSYCWFLDLRRKLFEIFFQPH